MYKSWKIVFDIIFILILCYEHWTHWTKTQTCHKTLKTPGGPRVNVVIHYDSKEGAQIKDKLKSHLTSLKPQINFQTEFMTIIIELIFSFSLSSQSLHQLRLCSKFWQWVANLLKAGTASGGSNFRLALCTTLCNITPAITLISNCLENWFKKSKDWLSICCFVSPGVGSPWGQCR